MALPVGTEIADAARALLTDIDGDTYDDATLLPFLQRAYRYAARYLRAKKVGLLRKQSGVLALTIGQTTLTRTPGAVPNYPSDMLRPIALRERQTGGGAKFTNMVMSDGFLPDRDADDVLGHWDWRDDKIETLGAKQNRDVQVLYEADFPAIATINDTFLIPDSLDALAAIAASFAAATRDEQTNSEKLRQLGERDLDLVAASELMVRAARGAQFGSN